MAMTPYWGRDPGDAAATAFLDLSTVGNAWAWRAMWMAGVVVAHPFTEDSAKVSSSTENEVVQTFARNGSGQSFAMCVGCGHMKR